MHDLLYEHQNSLSQDDLKEYAAEIGLDVEKFAEEIKGNKYRDRVEEDLQSGQESGVSGTPEFFINAEPYDGPFEFEALLAALAEAGEFTDIQESLELKNRKLRDKVDRSEGGAPAAGKAVRDRFSADEIFQRITASAEEEIDRNARLLFFSGLAAGMGVAITFFGRAIMTTAYPFDPTGLGNLLYPDWFRNYYFGWLSAFY